MFFSPKLCMIFKFRKHNTHREQINVISPKNSSNMCFSPVNLDQKWGQPPTNCNRIFFTCRWFSGPSSIYNISKIHQNPPRGKAKFLIKNAKEIYRLLSHRHNGKTNHKLPNSTSTVYFFKNMIKIKNHSKSIDILQLSLKGFGN